MELCTILPGNSSSSQLHRVNAYVSRPRAGGCALAEAQSAYDPLQLGQKGHGDLRTSLPHPNHAARVDPACNRFRAQRGAIPTGHRQLTKEEAE